MNLFNLQCAVERAAIICQQRNVNPLNIEVQFEVYPHLDEEERVNLTRVDVDSTVVDTENKVFVLK